MNRFACVNPRNCLGAKCGCAAFWMNSVPAAIPKMMKGQHAVAPHIGKNSVPRPD